MKSVLQIHFITEHLWKHLKKDENLNSVLNIISICNQIALASETGLAVALCLMWAIMCEISDTKTEMFCFRNVRFCILYNIFY